MPMFAPDRQQPVRHRNGRRLPFVAGDAVTIDNVTSAQLVARVGRYDARRVVLQAIVLFRCSRVGYPLPTGISDYRGYGLRRPHLAGGP